MKLTFTEAMTDLTDRDEVYATISKEDLAKLFEDVVEVPSNDDGKKDDSYVSGEVQFIFTKEGELEEILIAPVYETEDGYANGECISAPDVLWNEEKKAKKYLKDKAKPAKKVMEAPTAAKKSSTSKKIKCDGAYVVMAEKNAYVTYEGIIMGKKGPRNKYELHLKENCSAEDFGRQIHTWHYKMKQLIDQKGQLGELDVTIDMANMELLNHIYDLGYAFDGTWYKMRLDYDEMRPFQHEKQCEESGFQVFCVKGTCTKEESFPEHIQFYEKDGLKERIVAKIDRGGSLYVAKHYYKTVCSFVTCPEETVEISNLFTAEDERRKYFARDLLLYMIEQQHKAGRDIFTCYIPAKNYDAIYCAQQLGFRMEKAYARMFYLLESV
ncbi:MAG: hypothetical protein II743_04315 [Lachnospiraceae bacterium]|nr:hypothetical protein [Lachnospiraceae bacterium]